MDINNPCKYSYIESDDLTDLTISDEWVAERLLIREQVVERNIHNFNKEDHPVHVLKDNLDYYIAAVKVNNLGQTLFRRTKEETPSSNAEYCQAKFAEQCGTTLPKAFDALDKQLGAIDSCALVFINGDSNYRAEKHFHVRNPLDKTKDRHTVTVVIPYKIVDPVTSYVKFQYNDQLIDKKSGIDINIVRDHILRTEADPDLPIQSVRMPDAGEYLVLDFNGTKCLHWIEDNGCRNEYLCLVAET